MTALPFSAVVGQSQAKRALLLATVEPRLGGVLLRGDKGSAKTTLARGLAALLRPDAPFVELPLGATEDRLIGSLDLAELLTTGEPRFHPGLLAEAHGGVLYVDEINLLADHLVDVLLDVAVSGTNRVEREGLSHTHPARFVLIGSMNPEEGELRPQLLDRFGLAVDIAAPSDVADRVLAVRRQLAAEAASSDEPSSEDEEAALRAHLAAADPAGVSIDDDLIEVASRLALAVEVDGLRGDLMLCRAAAANAALDGRLVADAQDLRAVADLVLAHRRRRRPFDEPGMTPDELDQAWDQATRPQGESDPDDADERSDEGSDEVQAAEPPGSTRRAVLPVPPGRPPQARRALPGRGGSSEPAQNRGRYVRDQPLAANPGARLDARATATALARRRAEHGPDATLQRADLRGARREEPRATLVVFVVDASASMGVEHRMAGTKAAIMGLLEDAYRRRGRVALVTFHHDEAEVVLRPTGSIEVARARLRDLPTGGRTPLASGLDAATSLLSTAAAEQGLDHLVVVVTDGRATAGPGDPVEASRRAADRLARTGAEVLVIDTEAGPARLGLAGQLADLLGARCLRLDELGTDLEPTVRAAIAPGRLRTGRGQGERAR